MGAKSIDATFERLRSNTFRKITGKTQPRQRTPPRCKAVNGMSAATEKRALSRMRTQPAIQCEALPAIFQKELVMKRIIAALAIFTATTLGLTTLASAQEAPFRVAVPFAFTVGNSQLPLGEYQIQTFGTRQVRIDNTERGVFASALGIPGNRSVDDRKKLVFDKIGEQYFLKEIVSHSTAIEIPKSKSEKRARKSMPQSLNTDARNDTPQPY
jgi:hypothetical protein